MDKANKEIREKAKEAGVYIWQIAEHIGVHDQTLNRWLRTELPDDKKDLIMAAVEDLRKGES